MPADPFKKLLVRLTLDNKEFKQMLAGMRSDLKSLFSEFHTESAKQTAHAKELLSINKSQVAIQQKLQAEAKTLFEVDKSKAQWEKQQQEALNTKIKSLALQTAEMKKQSLEASQQLKDEKQSLLLQKEKLALKEKEVNLFKAGAIRAQVKYTGFKGPDSTLPLADQANQIANEKLRLQALDKQVVALEAAGKYRRIDSEYVRSLIASERALADVADTNVRRAQLQLKTLEQQAFAASKVASLSAMTRIKTGIGYTGYTAVDKSLGVEAQRATLEMERQKFALMERELNVISKSSVERRVDVDAVSKELQLQHAQLGLDEQHIRNLEKASRLQSQAIDPTQVAQIRGAVGFESHPHQQPTGFLGKMFGPSASGQMKEVEEERARLQIMQQQLRVLLDEDKFRKVDIAEVQKAINAEQNRLGLLQAQLRTQVERKEVELGIGEVRSKFAELFQGGGIVGQIAGGVFMGAAGFAVFNAIIDKAKELGQALTQASGPANQLRAQFEALAERKGQDPSQMLEKLRASTRGLVRDFDLFRVANNFLKSGMKVSSDQMTELVGTTFNLGRGMAKSSDEIIHALERAFLNPQYGMRRLAYVTGIDVRRLQSAMAGLPQTMDPVTRATLTFNHVLAEEERMLQKVGVPALTLPELLKQIEVANINFVEDVAMAATGTTSFRDALGKISTLLTELGPKLHSIAEAFGRDLAGAFDWVTTHKDDILHFFEVLIAFKVTDWALGATSAVIELTRSLKALTAIEGIADVLGGLGAGKLLKTVLKRPEATLGSELATVGKGVGETAVGVGVGEAAAGVGAATLAPVVVGVLGILGLGWLIDYLIEKKAKEGIDVGKIVGTGAAPVGGVQTAGMAQEPIPEIDVILDSRKQMNRLAEAQHKQASTQLAGLPGGGLLKTLPSGGVTDEDAALEKTIQEQRKLAQERMQLSMSVAKLELENTKQEITSAEQLNKVKYDSGIISLAAYTQQAKAIKQTELTATLREIDEEKKARLKQLDDIAHATIDGIRYQVISNEELSNRRVLIQKGVDLKVAATRLKLNSDLIHSDQALLANQESAYQGYIETLKQINEKGVQERVKIIEKEFQQGRLSADEYISQRKMLIEEEYELTTQGLDEQLSAAKDNAAEIEKINSKKFMAESDRISKLIDLEMNSDQTRLKITQTRFDDAKKYLETQGKLASMTFGVGSETKQVIITQELSRLSGEYIARLQKMPDYQNAGTEAWVKINEQIAEATQQQRQYNIELAKMRDTAAPLANLFGEISGILGRFQHSTGAQAVAETLQNMQGAFEHISKFTQATAQYGGAGGFFGNLGASFKSLFQRDSRVDTTAVKMTAQQIFDQGLIISSDKLEDFSTQIIAVTQALREMRDVAKSKASDVREGIINTLMPSHETGTDYVKKTGPAFIHKGERVVTATVNKMIHHAASSTPMTGTGTVVSIMQMLGLGHYIPKSVLTGPGGATNTLAMIPQPYQSTVNYISAIDPKFMDNLQKGMKSTSGSAQRIGLISEALRYMPESFSGKDMRPFFNWLKTGTMSIPSFQFGGTVPGMGPKTIEAHGGEHIFPQGVMESFVSSIKTATDAMGQFATKVSSFSMGKGEAGSLPDLGASGSGRFVGPLALPSLASMIPGTMSLANAPVPSTAPTMPGGSPAALNPGLAIAEKAGGPSEAPLEEFKSSLESINKIPFADKFKGFTEGLTNAAQGVMGFISSITSAKTGAQGAISGAMGGMKLGEAGGPIGMAIGAVAGGVMGGIFGAKEKQLQQDIHKIQGQMQSIVDSMNEGAITLSQAIADMRRERQAAIEILSHDPKGGKGGGKGGKKGYSPSQAQAVINQIDAQIGQLVNEQKQLLDQLNQQVAMLSSPAPFQQYVQSLDQIIQKYQQFSSAAAGNAQEVANAQLYLNESLQQYVTTLSQQLNQAQQQAIQDSLTLLNLEYQRQQIINQEAQQEYDILTQGVLTRQRTTAMTKGQEIGQLRYQRDMQLQQIDEQIALQQYKVSTEQKIFDMSTTRIGLEMQLLSLQEQQAGVQNGQTAALLQVVQQLQTAMSNGTLENQITALSAGGASPTGTGLLTTLLGSLGLGGYVPGSVMTGTGGATNYLSQIPQQYQSITNFVNNLDPNFLMNLWHAMQTPGGSSQRQSVASEAAQFAPDANTSGYDMGSFVNWIKSGSEIKGTVATINNAPVSIGAQPLPAPTGFPMPTTTGYAPTGISSSPFSGVTPFQSTQSQGIPVRTPTITGPTGSMDTLTSSTNTASQALQNFSDVLNGIQTGYTGAQQAAGGTVKKTGIYGNPIYAPMIAQLPHYQVGTTYVPQTGPAIVDEGEAIIPKPIAALMKAAGFFTTSQAGQGPEFPPLDPGMPTTGTMMLSNSSLDLAVHNQIYDMANKKAAVEMTVISARSSLLSAEMAHLSALNDTMDKMASLGNKTTTSSLEDQFQQLYETRGRYGSGNFRREYL